MTEAPPQLLNDELLTQFGERLTRLGVPAIAAAQPGLTAERIESLLAPLGLSLPTEVRTWWGWHDGVAEARGPAATALLSWRWFPLTEAIAFCGELRRMAAEIDEAPSQTFWGDSWLPVCGEQGPVVIETDVPDEAPCPVHIWWPEDPAAPAVLPSLGELILLWIEAIDCGVWCYDRTAERWACDHAHLSRWAAVKLGAL
jgi:cell wall assembly regulator SMI1